MCIRGKQHGSNMDIDKLFNVVKNNDFSEHEVVITGGEPTIHEKYFDIVKLMCKYSKKVTVTSNGTLDLKIDELKGLDNLFFQISLDGDTVSHNLIRGEGAFEKTWDNILKLDALGVNYSVASVVNKKNRDRIFKLLPLLEQLNKLNFWKISYEMPFGSAAGIDEIMTASEWNIFVNEMLMKAKLRLKIKKLFPFDLYDKKRDELEMVFLKKKRSTNCGSGTDKLYVYPDFQVYPCTCLTDFCIGNLSQQSLDEIVSSKLIKKFSEYEIQKDAVCQNCEYKKFCNGGCIGMSYHYFGKLGMGDMRCPKFKLK